VIYIEIQQNENKISANSYQNFIILDTYQHTQL